MPEIDYRCTVCGHILTVKWKPTDTLFEKRLYPCPSEHCNLQGREYRRVYLPQAFIMKTGATRSGV